MDEDRRKRVRIKKSLTAIYSYVDHKEDRKLFDETQIRDISEKGISAITIKAFKPQDTLTFLIKIPSNPLEWLEIKGKVVESKKLKTVFDESVADMHITRVEFMDLTDEQKKMIRVYVAWFLVKEGGKQ